MPKLVRLSHVSVYRWFTQMLCLLGFPPISCFRQSICLIVARYVAAYHVVF